MCDPLRQVTHPERQNPQAPPSLKRAGQRIVILRPTSENFTLPHPPYSQRPVHTDQRTDDEEHASDDEGPSANGKHLVVATQIRQEGHGADDEQHVARHVDRGNCRQHLRHLLFEPPVIQRIGEGSEGEEHGAQGKQKRTFKLGREVVEVLAEREVLQIFNVVVTSLLRPVEDGTRQEQPRSKIRLRTRCFRTLP